MTGVLVDAGGFSLSDADFDRFRDFFYGATGIQFGPTKRYFVDKRIGACIAQSGRGDFGRWFSAIRRGGDSTGLQDLINSLTVNETYFFRESYQFDALVNTVLPAVVSARQLHKGSTGRIRILCLPCSTGEEAFSVALSLIERWPALEHIDVEVVGADIDTKIVASARAAVYGPRSMHRVGAKTREAHFEPVGEGNYRVNDDVRGAVDFRVTNLFDPAAMRSYRDFDVVFCRNLLIYFDALSSRQAAENLYGALRPGGYLFLGHSESMSRISSIFNPVKLPDGIVYQRPEKNTP